jgi:hypothetical protein
VEEIKNVKGKMKTQREREREREERGGRKEQTRAVVM